METPSLTAAVRAELLVRPGVTEATHRFGGIVFHLHGHELGHVHGETVADLPFPQDIRDELVASGRLSAADVASDSVWVSRRVDRPQDVADIVELFRMSYEHAASLPPRSRGPEQDQEAAPSVYGQRRATWRDVVTLRVGRRVGRRNRP
jgi:hypothetical protein